ncbi:MAG: peptide chain release factor N(5)-glutamine methyltransferase [Synergistaceae bacterium]|nr:peptide chain release factor N(5)-glutamine methyltransferase [Synergistaceae bacterium]
MKLGTYRKTAIEKLTCAGIERPAYVVDTILSRFLDIPAAFLTTHAETDVSSNKLHEIEHAIAQRIQRMPLSYILGEAEFYGHVFKVGKGCLIPRPETEILVEEMLKVAPKNAYFADWCTGSGCIAVAMLLERADLRGIAVDSSGKALEWAEKNRALYGLENKLELILNSNPAKLSFKKQFDFITANPPYISILELPNLMKDVIDYEPEAALNGGKDGLECYRLLFETLPLFVKAGGYIGFETAGDEQSQKLKEAAPDCLELFKEVEDYSGILRHLIWKMI